MSQPKDPGLGQPLVRFKPTNGSLIGYTGLALSLFALGYVVVAVHSVVGLRIGLAALFVAVLIWVTQLRPRAIAYQDVLVLRGPLRDTYVPYTAIDEVTVTQMLNVFVSDRRYVCIGIGNSITSDVRQRAKKERQRSQLGQSRAGEFSAKAEAAAPDQTAMSYTTFVATRIEELVDAAKRDSPQADTVEAEGPGDPEARGVRQRYAVPEIAALAVSGVAFVGSLLL
jgi:hypothetical protein